MNHNARLLRVRRRELFSTFTSTYCGLKTDQSSNPGISVAVGATVFVGLSVGTGLGKVVGIVVGATVDADVEHDTTASATIVELSRQ